MAFGSRRTDMARSASIERRMLAMAATDIRLMELGDTLAMLWVRLVAFVIECGTDGLFVAGCDGSPTLAGLAQFRFRVSETQLKTYLETYAQTRLITWDETHGAIGLPAALMPSRRAIASRENGKKGGRPPKNANLTPRNDPRQRHAIMPISGGLSMRNETQQETHETSRTRIAKLEADNSSEAIASFAVNDADFHRIGRAALDAAGFDPARSMADYGVVRQWLVDAAKTGLTVDQAERVILSTVQSAAQRATISGKTVRSLMYFRNSVPEAIARRDVPAPVLSSAVDYEADARFREAHKAWVRAAKNGDLQPQPRREEFLAKARSAA